MQFLTPHILQIPADDGEAMLSLVHTAQTELNWNGGLSSELIHTCEHQLSWVEFSSVRAMWRSLYLVLTVNAEQVDALVFISYSEASETTVLQIRDRLTEAGFKVWTCDDDTCMYSWTKRGFQHATQR